MKNQSQWARFKSSRPVPGILTLYILWHVPLTVAGSRVQTMHWLLVRYKRTAPSNVMSLSLKLAVPSALCPSNFLSLTSHPQCYLVLSTVFLHLSLILSLGRQFFKILTVINLQQPFSLKDFHTQISIHKKYFQKYVGGIVKLSF